MKTALSWGDTGRTFFMFFFWLFLLSFILHFGMGLDPSGDPEFDRALKAQMRWLGMPIEWVVIPFPTISASLLAWIDSRQRERKRASRGY